jgi:hypothetical protein
MDTFTFKPKPFIMIRRAYLGRSGYENEQAERALLAHLNLALNVLEAAEPIDIRLELVDVSFAEGLEILKRNTLFREFIDEVTDHLVFE